MQVQEPKIDETELLDNLLTICEGDNKGHPILSNKNKVSLFIRQFLNLVQRICWNGVRYEHLWEYVYACRSMWGFKRKLSASIWNHSWSIHLPIFFR